MAFNYWEEAVAIALEEAGVTATAEQLKYIAESIEGCHDNYGMAMGYDVISNPLDDEVARLKAKIRRMEEESAKREDEMLRAACRIAKARPEDVEFSNGNFVYRR